jgi:predicted nucleic-acid-binding Zn-ribbon protein
MSVLYSESDFLKAISSKCPNPQPCPFCGSLDYVSDSEMAMISVQKKTDGIRIGKSIPCGLLLCHNCGYVNFFALGALGLLPKNDGDDNAQK